MNKWGNVKNLSYCFYDFEKDLSTYNNKLLKICLGISLCIIIAFVICYIIGGHTFIEIITVTILALLGGFVSALTIYQSKRIEINLSQNEIDELKRRYFHN